MVYICRQICCLAYNPACCSVLHRLAVCCSFMVVECCIACQVHESCLARVAVSVLHSVTVCCNVFCLVWLMIIAAFITSYINFVLLLEGLCSEGPEGSLVMNLLP